MEPYLNESYALPMATGVIELLGHREGMRQTKLYIGFSAANPLPLPTFHLTPDTAIGTMSLTPECYAAFMQLASERGAYFQIGGDGSWNALSSDKAGLENLED